MNTLKGPAIFLAQCCSDEAPFNSLDTIAAWASSLGFKGVQIPTWDSRVFDLERAATSLEYCEEFKATLAKHNLVVTELRSEERRVGKGYRAHRRRVHARYKTAQV